MKCMMMNAIAVMVPKNMFTKTTIFTHFHSVCLDAKKAIKPNAMKSNAINLEKIGASKGNPSNSINHSDAIRMVNPNTVARIV